MGNFLFPFRVGAWLLDFREESSGRLWQFSCLFLELWINWDLLSGEMWKQDEIRKKGVFGPWVST